MKSTEHGSSKGAGDTANERSGPPQAIIIDSRALLNGRDTIDIAHQGELYRLRLTRQGKLILTK